MNVGTGRFTVDQITKSHQAAYASKSDAYAGVFDPITGEWIEIYQDYAQALAAFALGREVTRIGKVGLYVFDGKP